MNENDKIEFLEPLDDKQSLYIQEISKKLQLEMEKIVTTSKRFSELKATYYWNPTRSGIALLVSDDGSYLGATSSVNFEKHLEEFKNGKRNGNFNINNKLIQMNCRNCGKGIKIDCNNLPTTQKTLDFKCSNCNTFIKVANLNYIEQNNKSSDNLLEVFDKETNCSILVPKAWKNILKTEKIEHVIFSFITSNNVKLEVFNSGKCTNDEFNVAYNMRINAVKKGENVHLLKEKTIELDLEQGKKIFYFALFEKLFPNNEKKMLLHTFTLINNNFVRFSILVDENIDYIDDNVFEKQQNFKDLMFVLLSIYEFNEEELRKQKEEKMKEKKESLMKLLDDKISELDKVNNIKMIERDPFTPTN